MEIKTKQRGRALKFALVFCVLTLIAVTLYAVLPTGEESALYDGFIICHGTDTLAYSAAALSYLIQNADKPIILTGAQQPISNEITDAKKNLRDSVICAIDPGSRGGLGQ